MDIKEKLIDSYLNDGYIYCILQKSNNQTQIVKIGKMSFASSKTKEQLEQRLLLRYSTYFPGCSIFLCERTGNHHLAEKMVFKELSRIHHKKEWYFFNEAKIKFAFKKSIDKYPSVEILLGSCYDLSVLNRANRDIRVIQKSP